MYKLILLNFLECQLVDDSDDMDEFEFFLIKSSFLLSSDNFKSAELFNCSLLFLNFDLERAAVCV